MLVRASFARQDRHSTQASLFCKISIAIGQRKLLREQMYRRTDEETMYCSITKISIQSVIGITNNFEALCTSLLRNYPWYTHRTWIEPQSAVTGMSVVNTHRMK